MTTLKRAIDAAEREALLGPELVQRPEPMEVTIRDATQGERRRLGMAHDAPLLAVVVGFVSVAFSDGGRIVGLDDATDRELVQRVLDVACELHERFA